MFLYNKKTIEYIFFIIFTCTIFLLHIVTGFSQVANQLKGTRVPNEDNIFLSAPQLKYTSWKNYLEYPNAPSIKAESYLLVHVNTGQVIYNYNSQQIMPIASLTKIMTALLVFEAISQKDFFLDKQYDVRQEHLNNLPFDASIMGLQAGDKPTGEDLLKGLLIHSANDAANVLAFVLAGSIDNFVFLMNNKAVQLQLMNTRFSDSSGLSAYNVSTAEDIARLSIYFLKRSFYFPVTDITSLPSIRWKGRIYKNTNLLIQKNKEVDGLKTGYTEEAGFHIVTTAFRKQTRLLSVLMRVKTNSLAEGVVLRSKESWRLLQYGLDKFQPIRFTYTRNVGVLGGKKEAIKIYTESPVFYVPTQWIPRIDSQFTIIYKNEKSELWAPIEEDAVVGNIRFYLNESNKTIAITTLFSSESVEKSSFIRRIIDFFKVRKKNL